MVKPPDDKSKASFGMTVTLRRDDGREQTFKIVGEDEADPSRGTVSYVSPLARAVLTHVAGETVVIANQLRPSYWTCAWRALRSDQSFPGLMLSRVTRRPSRNSWRCP